jgi:ubiquinone/menaquinone biosynthesis methyltransferase
MTAMKKERFTLKIRDYPLRDPVKKKKYNESLFSEIAPRYDFITRALSFGRDRAWKKKLVDELPAAGRPRCLDLACGTGDIALLLARRYPGARVTGLDLNRDMLALAEKAALRSGVEFRRADMCRTGFPDGTFDVVTGGYALRNAPGLERALAEIRRVMKPGGRGAFLDFAKSHRRPVRAAQLALLEIWGYFWGLVLHGNGEVYGYIAESLKTFPDNRELAALLVRAGFRNVALDPLFGGMTQLIRFEK